MRMQSFFFALSLLLVSFALQSQNIDTTSEWRVNFQWNWFPGELWNNHYRDFIDGDTVINSIQYYKVYQSGYSFSGIIPVGEVNSYDHVLHGFLREENNKWFTFFGNEDALLFDFNLGVNDTVFSAYTYPINTIIIIAVDSVLIDGDYKKRMQLNGYGPEYIIEDIGATSGLFEDMNFAGWYSYLICYAKNGTSVWGASNEECDLAVNITDNQSNFSSFSIYPNPCSDYFILTCPTELNQVSFTLIDALGKITFKVIIKNSAIKQINVNDYASGIYFAIFESNGQKHTQKLIIE